MAYEQRAPQRTDYGQLIAQSLGAFRNVYGLGQQADQNERLKAKDAETAEIKDLRVRATTDPKALQTLYGLDPIGADKIQTSIDSRKKKFEEERANLAAKVENLPWNQQVSEIGKHIRDVKESGRSPENTQNLYAMVTSNDPEQRIQGQNLIKQARITGEQQGYLKPRAVGKVDKGTSLKQNLLLAGYKEGSKEYEKAAKDYLQKSGKTNVTVEAAAKADSEEKKYRARKRVDNMEAVRERARGAENRLFTIEQMLVNPADTGAFAKQKLALASLAKEFNIDVSNWINLPAGEAYQSASNDMVLGILATQKGSASEGEFRNAMKVVPNITNQKESNAYIGKAMKAVALRDIEHREFLETWDDTNDTYKGGEKGWNKHIKSTPMVSRYVKDANNLPVFYWEFEQHIREEKLPNGELKYPDWKRKRIEKAWKGYEDIYKSEKDPEKRILKSDRLLDSLNKRL